jgi:hypothetical protein
MLQSFHSQFHLVILVPNKLYRVQRTLLSSSIGPPVFSPKNCGRGRFYIPLGPLITSSLTMLLAQDDVDWYPSGSETDELRQNAGTCPCLDGK